MRAAGLSAVVVLVLMLAVAPAASAWITVGETPPKSSAVTVDVCNPGTYAVTATAVPPRYEIPGTACSRVGAPSQRSPPTWARNG